MSKEFYQILSHPLWDYFTKVPEEPKKAICNKCSKKLSHKTTITNLKSHLKRLHTVLYGAYMKKLKIYLMHQNTSTVPTNQTVYLLPFPSTSEHQVKYEVASPETQETEEGSEDMTNTDTENTQPMSTEEKRQIDARLLMFIIKSYQPVTIVEQQGFKRFTEALNADYVMLDRKDITKRILPDMYNKCMEEQKSIVKLGATTVCLTIDRWTTIYEDSLISITAHFITPNYQLKSVLLNCHYCESNSEDLERVLTETCKEWEIFDKINWCVTDDGKDVVQAINSLGWNHKACMAYKLNLTLQNSLKLCEETLSKVRKIVLYFDSNYEAGQMLDEYQTKRGTAEPLELIDSEHSSWTSKYDMIERFLTLQEAIIAIIIEQDDEVDLPDITNEDWITLKQLCKLLKPFNEATKELGVDKYASASKVIAVVNGLKDVLQEVRKRPEYYGSVKEVVECIDNELKERFDSIENEPNLALCTILDPRYKVSMFLDESAADVAKSNLVSEVEGLMKEHISPHYPLKMEEPSNENNEDGGEFSLWRRRTMILEKRLLNHSRNHYRLALQEVESYMQEELADDNPCEWWRSNEAKFPNLAKLFKTKCNKVATAVPSEQLFTEQGISLCERRNMMSLRKSQMIVFLHANLNDDDFLRLMPESLLDL